ncbi:MAG: TonB-dependent receptor plug domain-containing protein [Spirochaetia bacterium]|nr:TonB-dependent receptor plug domain-containing protein [Spirochaetota bacterium]MDW8112187.1 TonB-dependent receptor plug domain-containing protein [Spirochaetia bacterium]
MKHMLNIIIMLFIFLLQFGGYAQITEEDFFKIEESIVVAATKQKQTVSEAPATVYVIDQKTLRVLSFSELNQVLRFVPGVDVYDPDFFLFGGQRGFVGAFDTTLVLLDGVEMNNNIASESFISHNYPLFHVKRIEVIQGPASSLYGANAVGGIINLVTYDEEEINGIRASVKFGSYNTLSPSALLGGKIGEFRYKVFGRVYLTDGPNYYDKVTKYYIYAPQTPNINRRPNYSLWDYSDTGYNRYLYAKLSYGPFYLGGVYNYQIDGRGVQDIQWVYYFDEDGRDQRVLFGGFEQFLIPDFLKLKIEQRVWQDYLWGNHTQVSDILDVSPSGYPITNSQDTNITRGDIEAWRGFYSNLKSPGSLRFQTELQAALYFAEKHRLTVGAVLDILRGLGASWNRLDYSTLVEGPTNVIDVHPYVDVDKQLASWIKASLYAQWEVPVISEVLFVTLGGRGDAYIVSNQTRFEINPRSGIVLKPFEGAAFKLLVGKAFREPTVFELWGAANKQGGIQKLKSASTWTFELSWFQIISDWLQNSLAGFYNYGENFKVTIPEQGSGVTEVPIVRIWGAEEYLKITLPFFPSIQITLGYTYQTGVQSYWKVTVQGTTTNSNWVDGSIPTIPQHKGSVIVSYKVLENAYLSILNYIVGDIDPGLGNSLSTTLGRLPAYWIVDASLLVNDIFTFANTSYDLNIAVRNLLNQEWWNLNPRNGGAGLSPAAFPQKGINFEVSLTGRL